MKTKAMERPVLSYESEKKNLEAHVDLCAERYSRLEERLEGVEVAIKELHKGLMDESKRTGKIIIGASFNNALAIAILCFDLPRARSHHHPLLFHIHLEGSQ